MGETKEQYLWSSRRRELERIEHELKIIDFICKIKDHKIETVGEFLRLTEGENDV